MTTNGEMYGDFLAAAKSHIEQAQEVSYSGDLWNADDHILRAIQDLKSADAMLKEVSRTAFERVFKERAK